MKYIRVKYRDAQNKKKLFICAKIMDTHDMENDEFFGMYRDVSDEQLIDPPWILPKLGENALDRLYGSEEKGDEAQAAYLEQALYKTRKVCRYRNRNEKEYGTDAVVRLSFSI